MTKNKKLLESILSDLSLIEMKFQRLLDDESCRFVAEAYRNDLLNDNEWSLIKKYLKQALEFLSDKRRASVKSVIDPNDDPRNADWIRIAAANRLSGHLLPIWAALWFWWLKTDTSPLFWQRIGRLAESLGYPKYEND